MLRESVTVKLSVEVCCHLMNGSLRMNGVEYAENLWRMSTLQYKGTIQSICHYFPSWLLWIEKFLMHKQALQIVGK